MGVPLHRRHDASRSGADNEKGWRATMRRTLRHAKGDRLNVVAGSLAYRWFLSLFPILITLLGIGALVHLSPSVTSRLVHGASVALPSGASGVLTSAVKHAVKRTSGALPTVIVAGLVALFSGTSSMTVLQSGLDMAYDIAVDRKFVPKRLVALFMLAFAVVLGGAASALLVFGPQLGRLVAGSVSIGGTAFVVVWTVVRWVAAIALVLTLFAVLYWLGPNRATPRFKWLTPGAFLGTLLWALASLAFSYYTSSFGSYGKTYGAFAGVALLIFWFYVTGAVVLLGAEVNAEVEREGRPTRDAARATRAAQVAV